MTYKGSALAGRNTSIVPPDPSHLSGNISMVLLLTLLLLSTTISYIDRQALSIAAPLLRSRFNMSNLNYSEVLFAFLLAYALFHPVMGRFIDWIGARLGIALAPIFWSAAHDPGAGSAARAAGCRGDPGSPTRQAQLDAPTGRGGGSMNFGSAATPAGNYKLTVTGTYSSSSGPTPGTLANSTTLGLKVN
ncbi:MAG: hypothetical protein HY508_16025 [Acidobacteria bacterium]|nr:hypothetical protein [Acidobacteriota bacterium]